MGSFGRSDASPKQKGVPLAKFMAIVSFDMRFQYVFAGWEGSAFDSKILQDALWRRPYNRLQVPIGKFQFTSSRNKEYFIFVW